MSIFYNATTNGFYDDEIVAPPSGSIQITSELRDNLLAQQSAGMLIQPNDNGEPTTVMRPIVEPTPKEKIATLEATNTDRRIREAILGTDNGWLAKVNDEIAALRAQK
jgi:hypothetical protein